MGHETVVHGYIRGATRAQGAHFYDLHPPNRAVIDGLPDEDDWPFLSRAMFACPGERSDQGRYRTQLIHFGATLKEVEADWDEWIAKWENLLRRLYWTEARVYRETEFGDCRVFTWSAVGVTYWDMKRPALPPTEWVFSETSLLCPSE